MVNEGLLHIMIRMATEWIPRIPFLTCLAKRISIFSSLVRFSSSSPNRLSTKEFTLSLFLYSTPIVFCRFSTAALRASATFLLAPFTLRFNTLYVGRVIIFCEELRGDEVHNDISTMDSGTKVNPRDIDQSICMTAIDQIVMPWSHRGVGDITDAMIRLTRVSRTHSFAPRMDFETPC